MMMLGSRCNGEPTRRAEKEIIAECTSHRTPSYKNSSKPLVPPDTNLPFKLSSAPGPATLPTRCAPIATATSSPCAIPPPTPTLPHKGGGRKRPPPPLWGRVGVGGLEPIVC